MSNFITQPYAHIKTKPRHHQDNKDVLIGRYAAVNDRFLAGIDDDVWQLDYRAGRRGTVQPLLLPVPVHQVLKGNLLPKKEPNKPSTISSQHHRPICYDSAIIVL